MSIRIPAGKLGTVRVDRTVDVYPTPTGSHQTLSSAKILIPKLKLQCHSTEIPIPFTVPKSNQECRSVKITRAKNLNDDDEDDDIAVIYSVVRRSSVRRTSSPRASLVPLTINFQNYQAQMAKSYTLEPPLTPIISHSSKQAEIKTLSSTCPTATLLSVSSSKVTSSNRVQASTSFRSDERPSIPSIAVKPRPYSFRSTGRSALEKQISNITERVSQLQETFFGRLSNSSPGHQRNRSLSSFNSALNNTNESNKSENSSAVRPRPKSETFDDRLRVKTGKRNRTTFPIMVNIMCSNVITSYEYIWQ